LVVQVVQRVAVIHILQELVPQAVELRSTQLPVLLEHRVLASQVVVLLLAAPTVTGSQPVVEVESSEQEPAR
jgi:hypothetical protein